MLGDELLQVNFRLDLECHMKRVLLWCGAVAWGLLGFGGASAQDSPVCIADDNNPTS